MSPLFSVDRKQRGEYNGGRRRMDVMERIRDRYSPERQSFDFTEAMQLWFEEVIEKNAEELTEQDVARCISEGIFPEAACEALMRILMKNPLAGDLYEGELLELASELDDFLMARHISSIRSIVDAADEVLYEKKWEDRESRTAFRNSAVELRRLLEEDTLIDLLMETEDSVARNQIAIYLGSVCCDRAAEPIMNLITAEDAAYSRGPLIYSLQNMRISFDQLMQLIPLLTIGNMEEKATVSELLKGNLERLSEEEMNTVSTMLAELIRG